MEDWKKIEALLFASGKYLSEEQLISLLGISKIKIKKALDLLKKNYNEKDTSLAIFNEGNSWKLNVKEEFTDVIKEVVSDAEMPRAVMETLAIIAYKSPVLQSEIKDIRGTSVYEHIPLLEAKGFISRDRHGRSFKIKLTSKFHEYFDIEEGSKLAELFKDVKKPSAPEKLGDLVVYDDDKVFDEKILERMKKLEKTKKDDVAQNNFLNNFDERFEKTKQSIDESEQEIDSFKTRADEDSKEIFLGADSSDSSKDFNDNQVFDETTNITQEIQENDSYESSQDPKPSDKPSEEDNKDLPEFLKKVNKQIDELIKESDKNKKTKDISTQNPSADSPEESEDT